MPTIKSGAFAQQCYSSHPLSLTVKSLILFTPADASSPPAHHLTLPPQALSHPPGPEPVKVGSSPPDAPLPGGPAGTAPLPMGAPSLYRLVVSCDNCAMRHRFTIDTLTSRFGQEDSAEAPAMTQLLRCVAEHPSGLRVSGMDVVSDSVRLMCGECRRTYDLTVATVETYQKQ